MNKVSGFQWIVLFLLFSVPVLAQKKVYVSDKVRSTAEQIKVDYKGLVKKASAKDGDAVKKLLDFSRIVDGSEAIEHAVTCLELIPLASDEVMAKAIAALSPKLKKVLLDRMQQAQGRTQKAELKVPMEKWAPMSWEALHNRPYASKNAQLQTGRRSDREEAPAPMQDAEKAGPPQTAPGSGGRQ